MGHTCLSRLSVPSGSPIRRGCAWAQEGLRAILAWQKLGLPQWTWADGDRDSGLEQVFNPSGNMTIRHTYTHRREISCPAGWADSSGQENFHREDGDYFIILFNSEYSFYSSYDTMAGAGWGWLGQVKAKSCEFNSGLPYRWQGLKYSGHCLLSPWACIIRKPKSGVGTVTGAGTWTQAYWYGTQVSAPSNFLTAKSNNHAKEDMTEKSLRGRLKTLIDPAGERKQIWHCGTRSSLSKGTEQK